MKRLALPRINRKSPYLFSILLLTTLMLSLTFVWQTGHAQQTELTLADILTGLRSKKVPIAERNKLLTEAIKRRGVTFALTPEIEKELEITGADKELIETIRQKGPTIPAAPTPAPKSTVAPVPTPTPQILDAVFYQNRANSRLVKGEYDLAIADYNKVIELNSKDSSVYFTRGMAYQNKKTYSLALADYDKAIELNPQEAIAYLNRGDIYERIGDNQKAIANYRKVLELDADNEDAKNGLKRLQPETAKVVPETKKPEPVAPPESKPVDASEPVELGQLNNLATNLVTPAYPEVARKARVQGRVIVQITLNEEGKVVTAKTTSGSSLLRYAAEDAARKSKFKPTLVNNKAVKATGFISYNFVD